MLNGSEALFVPTNCDASQNYVGMRQWARAKKERVVVGVEIETAFCYMGERLVRVQNVDVEAKTLQCLEKDCPFYLPPRQESSGD